VENRNEQYGFDIENEMDSFMMQVSQIVKNRDNSDLAVRGKVTQLLSQYMEAN